MLPISWFLINILTATSDFKADYIDGQSSSFYENSFRTLFPQNSGWWQYHFLYDRLQ